MIRFMLTKTFNSLIPLRSNLSAFYFCVENKKQFSSTQTCYNCGGKGHMARDCKNQPLCRNCNEVGHLSKACTKPRIIRCFTCGQQGHINRNCPNGQQSETRPRSQLTCYNCQQVGHISTNCPNPRRERTRGYEQKNYRANRQNQQGEQKQFGSRPPKDDNYEKD